MSATETWLRLSDHYAMLAEANGRINSTATHKVLQQRYADPLVLQFASLVIAHHCADLAADEESMPQELVKLAEQVLGIDLAQKFNAEHQVRY